jgi:hypothetical protein
MSSQILSMGVLSCAEIVTDRQTDNIIIPILFMIYKSFN